MTTLVVTLTPALAKRLARATDTLGFRTHAACATEALRLFLRSMPTPKRPKRRRPRATA